MSKLMRLTSYLLYGFSSAILKMNTIINTESNFNICAQEVIQFKVMFTKPQRSSRRDQLKPITGQWIIKKHITSIHWTLEPVIQSCDSGQLLFFYSCQLLAVTSMSTIKLNPYYICLLDT